MLGSILCLILVLLFAYTFYTIGYNTCAKDYAEGKRIIKLSGRQGGRGKASHTYYFPVQPPEYCNYTAHGPGDHNGYPAADIFAPFGIPVIAVTDGTIEWISTEDRWNPRQDDPATRGGLAFALRGDDGVRYYMAHLSRFVPGIRRGTRLKGGQLIGYVGKSGDARFTPPHVLLGISALTTPDDWKTMRGQVWPGPYLDAWKNGEMLTPEPPP